MKVEVEKFTVEKCKTALSRQSNIRPVNAAWVRFLAEQIKQGRFHLNGETIKFDRQGRLIDGQHRMHASIAADMPITVAVARDCETSAGIDEGRARGIGDLLAGSGTPNSLASGAAARILFWISLNREPFETERVSNEVMLEYFGKLDLELLMAAVRVARTFKHLAPPSIIAAVAYQAMILHGQEMVTEFFASIASGANLADGSPQLLLRTWMESIKARRLSGSSMRRGIYIAVCRAWNRHLAGAKPVVGSTAIWSKIHDADLPQVG